MPAFDSLLTTVENQLGVEEAVQILVLGLADRIKATSNDQNVQALAAELRQTASKLAAAVLAKTSA